MITPSYYDKEDKNDEQGWSPDMLVGLLEALGLLLVSRFLLAAPCYLKYLYVIYI